MSARDKIRHAMTEPNAWGHYTPETAAQLLNAYRAEVLREAADMAEHFMARFPEMDDAKKAGVIGPFTAAGGIAEELRRMADAGKATHGNSQPTAGESTQLAGQQVAGAVPDDVTNGGDADPVAADFFQPGHTYCDDQYGWKFRVDTVTTHPENGERTALGWRLFHDEWEPYAYGEDDWEIHQLVGYTDGGEAL